MAKRKNEVTDSDWMNVLEENRVIVEEFLDQSMHLSDQTLKQYTSALRIYFYWVYENLNNKPFHEIRSIDYLKYQNWLTKSGMSSSGVRLKRSAISSLNSYIEVYYGDEYERFRNYINKGVKAPMQKFVNKKEPLTMKEYKMLCDELEKKGKWQHLAYIKFSFSSGCRRAEAVQLRKEVVEYEPKVKEIKVQNEDGEIEDAISRYYYTHEIRCKGYSKDGKMRRLSFDEDAMNALKKWISIRGNDNCEYVFVSGRAGNKKQISAESFNLWCRTVFEKIVGRRVHPHLFRESRATSLVVEHGRNISVVQKLLGHESATTSEIYVIRDDEDDADEAFI